MHADPKHVRDRLTPGQSLGWSLLATASAVAAGLLVRKLLEKGWEAATDEAAPPNPASPTVSGSEAAAWAVASGVLVGLSRLAARRGIAGLWQRSSRSRGERWSSGGG